MGILFCRSLESEECYFLNLSNASNILNNEKAAVFYNFCLLSVLGAS